MKIHAASPLMCFALGATLVVSSTLLAASYDEAVSGDLSDDRLIPTMLSLNPGSNLVRGTFGLGTVPNVPDLDYLTISVPPGTTLTRITLVQVNTGGAVSFIGLGAGTVITVPWDDAFPQALLGWHHFSEPEQGQDILLPISAGSGAIGFVPPLPSGTYALWIMELSPQLFTYEFDFVVSAPPVCEGDYDGNNTVNFADVTFILNQWNMPYTFGDVTNVLVNWGRSC